MAIAHPGDDATLGFTILTFGGPALFLITQVVFHRTVLQYLPRSRLLGLAALAILAVVTSPLAMIAGIAASSAVLVAVAVADTLARAIERRRDSPSLASSDVRHPLQPAHRELAPDRREIVAAQAVGEGDRERDRVVHADGHESRGQAGFGGADPAGHRDQPRQRGGPLVDEE
jgi:hypothetical protein